MISRFKFIDKLNLVISLFQDHVKRQRSRASILSQIHISLLQDHVKRQWSHANICNLSTDMHTCTTSWICKNVRNVDRVTYRYGIFTLIEPNSPYSPMTDKVFLCGTNLAKWHHISTHHLDAPDDWPSELVSLLYWMPVKRSTEC